MADAGVFYLTVSGGEILMRRDFFEILEYARKRTYCIKLKSNGILIRKKEADRIKALGVESVQISIYSHIAEVHDGITKLPGSLGDSIEAIRRLRAHGIHVIMANVLMVQNATDYAGVKALAEELGAQFIMDPTIRGSDHSGARRHRQALGSTGFAAFLRTNCCTYRGFDKRWICCAKLWGAEKTTCRWLQSVDR